MAPVLGNLLELYVHDLSDVFPIELGPEGRFGYDKLPLYWAEPAVRHAFLIKHGGHLAGFAFATRGSPASENPEDLDVAEFFVLRGHRRSGVGRRAAMALWDAVPGHWVVRVSEANRAGLPLAGLQVCQHSLAYCLMTQLRSKSICNHRRPPSASRI
jgi:predicted acetyltransferase